MRFVVCSFFVATVLGAVAADVACSTLTVGLDESKKGEVARLTTAGGRELASTGCRANLFELTFFRTSSPTATMSVASGQAKSFRAQNRSGGVRLVYEDLGEACEKVVCEVCVKGTDDDRIRWRIDVTPRAGWELEQTCYPCIELVDSFAETIVLGTTRGGVHRDPRKMSDWSSVKAKFPGALAAQFGCLYGGGCLFHFGAEDGIGVPKEIVFRRDPASFLALWRRYSAVGEGTKNGFDVVTAAAEGGDVDWHDSAELHRKWALTQPFCHMRFTERDDIPYWMREAPPMVRFGRRWLDRPQEVRAWLADCWRRQRPGVPLIVAFWGWEKVGTWISPDYFPFYPSDDEFARIVEVSKAVGGHVFLWPSGYHWAVSCWRQADGSFRYENREAFERDGAAHNTIERNGRPYFARCPWLDGGENARLCGGDAWTRNWFANRICRRLAERGCELMQVDQIVGGSIPVCWSDRHGHPAGDGAWRVASFRRQLDEVVGAMGSAVVHPVVGFEEPNELFLGTVGIQDYRDMEVGVDRVASVFNYLYHEFVPCFQSNAQRDARWLMHGLVDGQVPFFEPEQNEIRRGLPVLRNGDFARVIPGSQKPSEWTRIRQKNDDPAVDGLWRVETLPGGKALAVGSSPTGSVMILQNVSIEEGAFRAGMKCRLSAMLETVRPGGRAGVSFGVCAYGPYRVLANGRLVPPGEGEGARRISGDIVIPAGGVHLRVEINASAGAEVRVSEMKLVEVCQDGSDGREVVVAPNAESKSTGILRRWIDLYRGEGRPFLAYGRHLKPPVVEKTYADRIFASAYEAADGRQALVFANATAEKCAFTFVWLGRTGRMTLVPYEAVLTSPADSFH